MSLTAGSRSAVAAAGALVALALTACSPVLTHDPYSAGDGLRVTWAENAPIRAENILVIAEREGGDARVVGGVTNASAQDAEVTIGFTDGASDVVVVPANSTVLLDGSETSDLVLPGVPVPPGSTVEMTFATPTQGYVTLQVLVLDATFAEYEDLVP